MQAMTITSSLLILTIFILIWISLFFVTKNRKLISDRNYWMDAFENAPLAGLILPDLLSVPTAAGPCLGADLPVAAPSLTHSGWELAGQNQGWHE
jgi:ABC-type iron transport system FetAB permease component